MGHVVDVLAPLVEKWKPVDDESECYSSVDYSHASIPLESIRFK